MKKRLFAEATFGYPPLRALARFTGRLVNAGTETLTEAERRPVVSINSLALITGIMVFIFGLGFYALVPSDRLLLPVIFEGLAFFSLVLLNKWKMHKAANMGMYLIHCFSAIYFGATLGNALPVELVAAFLFVFLLGASLRIYKTNGERAMCALITVLLYFSVSANHHYKFIAPLHFEPTQKLIISYGCIFGMVVLMLFVTFSNMRENDLIIKEKDLLVEKLEEADYNRNRFMWEISHETRTPLNASLGNAQLLYLRKNQFRELAEGEEIISEINQVYVANCLMRDIINSVLDKAKIESGKMEEVILEPLDLQWVIDKSVGMNVLVANMRKVSIHLPDHELPFIFSDKVILLKILNNLISNAIKFTRMGSGVDIAVKAEDGQLFFSVTNRSILSKERAKKIFDPFISERNPFVEGTGLGLDITKRMIGILKGNIWVETDEREKTTFLFQIPCEVCPADAVLTGDQGDPGLRGVNFSGKEIVVIEDDAMNLTLLSKFIFKTGALPICFEDVESAMKFMKTRKPHLIISDAQMPNAGGKELLERLKTSPELSAIPVIIASGDLTSEGMGNMRNAGANAYLTKPFIFKELQKVISRCFNETTDFHIIT